MRIAAVLIATVVVFLLPACEGEKTAGESTSAPVKTGAAESRGIEGKWKGMDAHNNARFEVDLVLRADGTWEQKAMGVTMVGKYTHNGSRLTLFGGMSPKPEGVHAFYGTALRGDSLTLKRSVGGHTTTFQRVE